MNHADRTRRIAAQWYSGAVQPRQPRRVAKAAVLKKQRGRKVKCRSVVGRWYGRRENAACKQDGSHWRKPSRRARAKMSQENPASAGGSSEKRCHWAAVEKWGGGYNATDVMVPPAGRVVVARASHLNHNA